MLEHWARFPPVHITAALFTGVKSERADSARPRPAANDPVISNADVVRAMHADPRKLKWSNQSG